jgi:hypothetical protein
MPKKDINQITANIVALTTGTKVKEEIAKTLLPWLWED